MLGVNIENIRIPGTEWKKPEHLKRNPFGQIPGMETPEGNLFESLTLLRYLARKAGKMYGANAFETAQIDQWLEFFNGNLMPAMGIYYRTVFAYMVHPKERFDDAVKELNEIIKIMDNALSQNKFLGSKDMNIADVAFGLQFRALLRLSIPEKTRNANPNFMKWFNEVNSHPVIMKLFGKAWLCQKEFVPDFTFGKEKKEEKPKKEQTKKEDKPKK